MMARLMGVYAIIPTTVLLTVSLFVLVVLRKVENQGIKAFGYVVAALLWLSALLVFSTGIYTLAKGRAPMCCPMHAMMMKDKMCGMGMMKDKTGARAGMMKDKMRDMIPPPIESEKE